MIDVKSSVTGNNTSSDQGTIATSSLDSTRESSSEDQNVTHSSNCSTCSSSETNESSDEKSKQCSTDEDDDIPLSELKKKLNSTDASSSEDNLTLSEIKSNISKAASKAFFKMTRYELVKYKGLVCSNVLNVILWKIVLRILITTFENFMDCYNVTHVTNNSIRYQLYVSTAMNTRN